MSIDWWGADKQNMRYPHNGMLLSHKKEWNINMCYDIEEPGKHSAKWKEPDTQTTDFRIPFVCEISRLGIYRDGKQICGCQGIAEEELGRAV